MNLVVAGDSISVGVGASPSSNGWAYKFAANVGATLDSFAESGGMAGDMALLMRSFVASANDVHAVLLGANDERIYGTAKLDFFKASLLCTILDMALPTAGTPARTGLTLTGSWSNTQVSSIGVNSTQQGAKAVGGFSGDAAYIDGYIQNAAAAGGIASVKVDGMLVGSIDTNGIGATTQNGRSYPAASWVFRGFGPGQHSIEIEVTSSGKIFYLDRIRGSEQASRPLVLVGNVIRQSAAGYANNGGSDATVAAYNAVIAEIITDLQADGLNIVPVDAWLVIDPTTDLADGIHPNNAGHQKICDDFETAYQAQLPPPAEPAVLEFIYRGGPLTLTLDPNGDPETPTVSQIAF